MKNWIVSARRYFELAPRQWSALVAIPLLLLALFSYAFRDPVSNLSQVPAAVVNEDEPVTVDGQITPLGRELAASLVNAEDPNYDWTLTNAADAQDGLRKGHYRVVVTIPKSFSADATSLGSPDPQHASAAKISIESAKDVPLADAAVGRVLADAARRSLGTTITESYIDNLYSGLGVMRKQLGEAATGAKDLSKGADDLAKGTGDLRKGANQMAKSLEQLSTGAGQVADGADKTATGASQLANGTSQLSTGATQLASGLSTLKNKTADLPTQTQRLADGSAQVASGTQQIEDTAGPALDTAVTVIDDSPDAVTAATKVKDLAAKCDGTPEFCDKLKQLVDPMMRDAKKVDSVKADVRTKVVTARKGLKDLNDGAHQVAAGNKELAAGMVPLTQGIKDASSGANDLKTGAQQLDEGASELKTGTQQLKTGADKLSTGAKQAATGGHQLAKGAVAVDDGANALAKGAKKLATGLGDAVKQIPNYSEADRLHLKKIAAVPVATDVIGTDGYMNSAMSLFAVLALWAAALVAFSVLRAMPRDIVTSDRSSSFLAFIGSLPGAAVGAGAAVVASIILALSANATMPRFLMLLIACLVASATFMVLNRALAAMSPTPGRIVSIIILAMAAVTGITSAQPGILQSIAKFLPTTAALGMFRNALGGAFGPMWKSLVPLLFWLGLAYVATLVLTEKARAVPVRSFRAGAVGSANPSNA